MTLDLLPSLGLIFLLGLLFGKISEKIGLPSLVGLIFTGILLGNSGFSLLGDKINSISSELRQIALVMILLKAGLTLEWSRLKKVGRSAFFLAFLPASFEMFGCILLAPLLFGLTLVESALLGCVLAAVSPAVVVPRMTSFIERGIGSEKQVPELVLAGASLDDVFVVVLFSSFLSLTSGGAFTVSALAEIPISIFTGLFVGIGTGKLLSQGTFFLKLNLEQQILILFGLSCVFFGLEELFYFSPLLAVMSLGLSLTLEDKKPLASGFTSLWKGAEILLFVLVGAEVNLQVGLEYALLGVGLLAFGLTFRSVGVILATSGVKLSKKERVFAIISYLPKATVQAAIGGIPLAMGLDCGTLILTLAVLAILLTAPLGAFLIDGFGEKLLETQ